MNSHLARAFKFFKENAGHATPPGKAACALSLARAERDGKSLGLRFVWKDDPAGWDDWQYDKKRGYVSMLLAMPEKIEGCVAYHEDEELPVSLWGIQDADASYRRVVEAELAAEAIAFLEGIKTLMPARTPPRAS